MRKFLAALLVAAPLCAQNPNPQPSYAQTVSISHPSTWLRFNTSSATTFTDAIAGNNFSTSATFGQLPASTTNGTPGYIEFGGQLLNGGALSTIKLQEFSACSGAVTIAIGTNSGSPAFPQINVTDSFSLTLASTTGVQTFTAGTDFTPRNVAGGQLLGIFTPTSATCGTGAGPGAPYYYLGPGSSVPIGVQTYTVANPGTFAPALEAIVTSAGTVTPLQAGFDSNQKNNFSAAFSYNAWAAAPNGTTGDFDWFTPHSYYFHVDQATINRLGGATLVLTSKGDYTAGNGWELDFEPDTVDGFPLSYRACYHEHGQTAVASQVVQFVCSGNSINIAADGVGYDLLYSNAGTGWIGDDFLYINGVNGGGGTNTIQYSSQNNNGFGFLNFTVSGGTGYPTTVPINISGGGPHCVFNGVLISSGGVPVGVGSASRNSGCTGTPTCTLAASSGTGATFGCTVVATTLSNTSPLLIGAPSGISTDSSQAPINVDEFAAFPSALAAAAINIFDETVWYQNMLGAPPANPPLVLFDEDGDTDLDNQYALAAAIALDTRGYIRLVGIVNDDTLGSCQAMWRQMLDQAGLNQVPIATTFSFASGSSGCSVSNIASYNASTPTASAPYMNSTTLYRTILAKYSSTAVQLYNAGLPTALASFMQSGPDGISSLTGAQLLAQNTTNGGAIYMQGGAYCTPTSPPTPVPCSSTTAISPGAWDPVAAGYVFSNNGTTPLYFIQGTPQPTGQGALQARTSNDPLYLYANTFGDTRFGWDTLALATIFTNKFVDGVVVTASGGTGYATWTGITQTGGGTNCPAFLGWLHATGGVPDLVGQPGGSDSNGLVFGTYAGLGYGCTSLPTLSLTAPTGTGVTLTRTLNSFCGTLGITGTTPNFNITTTSASCSHHNFVTLSWPAAQGTESPWFRWWANSFINPSPVGQPRVQH